MKDRYIVLLDHEPGAVSISSELREKGYRVVCVSRSARSAAGADAHISASGSLAEIASAIRTTARLGTVLGVYTVAENSKFRQLDLNAHLGLDGDSPFSVTAARDKGSMRQLFKESGLATHDWYFVPDQGAVGTARLPFPLVCKPNLGFASGGVQIVGGEEEYRQAVQRIRRLNRLLLGSRSPVPTGTVVEEYLAGPEYALDAITWQGETRVFSCCGKKYPAGNELLDFAYYSPAVPELLAEFNTIVANCARSLRYEFGPTHTELRWDSRRSRWQVVETALRVGFMGHIGTMIRETTGVDYNYLAIMAALRQHGAEDALRLPLAFQGVGLVFSPEIRGKGHFGRFSNLEALRQDPRVRSVEVIPEPGDWLSADSFNYGLILVARVEALGDLDAFLTEAVAKTAIAYV